MIILLYYPFSKIMINLNNTIQSIKDLYTDFDDDEDKDDLADIVATLSNGYDDFAAFRKRKGL